MLFRYPPHGSCKQKTNNIKAKDIKQFFLPREQSKKEIQFSRIKACIIYCLLPLSNGPTNCHVSFISANFLNNKNKQTKNKQNQTESTRKTNVTESVIQTNSAGMVCFENKSGQKLICRPQSAFFPLIKVSPQFLIKGTPDTKIWCSCFSLYPSLHSLFNSLYLGECTFLAFQHKNIENAYFNQHLE